MSNVIIGIHGLGNKPPKKVLENWWKLAMIEGLKTNNYKSILPKFELVYWADILHKSPYNILEKNPDDPQYLREKYVEADKNFKTENHDTRKKLVEFLDQQMKRILLNEDLSLNFAFINDVIVRNFFKDLETYYTDECKDEDDFHCNVKDLINNRLIQILEKHKDDKIMLVSHSMGSIIAFDVLSFKTQHIPVDTFITAGSPLGLPVVISKIAAEQKRNASGNHIMTTPPSVLQNWYNFSEILDKVALNYRLDDDFSENSHGIMPIDYLVINNYEINGKRNPHKSYGYLRTPEFSQVLNEFIQSEKITLTKKVFRSFREYYKKVVEKIQLKQNSYET